MTWNINPSKENTYGSTNFDSASSGGTGVADNMGNHIATQNINLGSQFLSPDGTDKGIRINPNGSVDVGDYTLPTVDGLPGQVLSTNGSGQLTWVDAGTVPTDEVFLFQDGTTYTFQDGVEFTFN